MRFSIVLRAATAAVLAVLLAMPCAIASAQAERADGTYTAKYVVLKAENDSVSMANDYWEKPATVIIAKGTATVRLTVNHSKWVTQFKVPGSGGAYVDTKVIETDKKQDKRVVEFKAADLDQPILAKIHVTVEEIDYDHDYTIRMVFDADSFKLIKAAEQPKPSPTPATPTPAATAEPAPTASPAQSAEAPAVSAAPTPASTASAGQPRPNETAAAQILAAPPSASPATTASPSPQQSPTAAAESAAPSTSAEPSGQSTAAGSGSSSDDGTKADVKIAAAATSGEPPANTLETAAQAAAQADASDASGGRIWWLIGIAAVLAAVGGGLYARKAMRGR